MGRTGICYDNAMAESFFAALKNELCNRTVYPTRAAAMKDIARYIETRYNPRRLHSAIGYRPPNEVYDAYQSQQQTAQQRQNHCSRNAERISTRRRFKGAWRQASARCARQSSGVLSALVLGDLGADLVHVQVLDRRHDLLERSRGQRAGLGEDEDAVPERHQGRDRGDAHPTGELLLGVGVDLRVHDVGVLRGRRLEDGPEHAARAAPRGPEVDEHDAVAFDGLLEGNGIVL